MKLAVAVLALSLAPAFAQVPHQPILEIAFAGNDTTQPAVMLREMSVRIFDPADPIKIERSRQGIQDLGLFKSVSVQQIPIPGGVRLTFTVEEKWYILPIPRYGSNSDGKDTYGLSLRWFNIAGRNQTLRSTWSNSDDQKANKGRRTSYDLDYSIPFIFDSSYHVGFSAGHSSTPIFAAPDYLETFDWASAGISRTFATEAASQGWTYGANLAWRRQDTHGVLAPAPYGRATSLGLSAGFRDIRYRVYSEDGVSYDARLSSAADGLASEYSFNSISAAYKAFLPVGATPHQNLHLYAYGGSYHGGPTGVKSDSGVFSLGGASSLRGYSSDSFEGDAFYYLAAEYLRPLVWDWLRLAVIGEAGNVFADVHDFSLSRTNASIGLGFRLRLISFVNFELEAGMAWPLNGGSARFFASKV